VTPAPVKRAHQRMLDARFHRLVDGASREVVARHGLEVARGPFAGMRYLEDVETWSSDLVAKLTGEYERELHGAIAEWIDAAPDHVVDVGCAEGFYAVGLSLAIPNAVVHAYDLDPASREACARLAAHNGVGTRIRIGGACTPETLATMPDAGVVLLADCEGYERELLDPAAAPVLRGWPIVVELHEFLDPQIAETIRDRFTPTHDVELVSQQPRDPSAVPELAGIPPRSGAALLSELRPAAMRWAVLRPRRG
jgi:hypothetical protein